MNEQDTIRVLTVDDHEIMRGGIKYLLLAVDDIELVGEAGSGAEAIQLCETLHPDVILMDMRMPGLDGVETTRRIRANHPQIRILALTSFEDEVTIQQVIQAGAIGYLQKGISIDELAGAIRAAQAGKPTLSPEAFDVLVRSSASQATEPALDLTDRELQVLEMLVRGASNSEIAEGLVITEATVKYHVSNLLSKLEANNRTEAAARAVQHRLVSDPA
jgi:NarL family two-component system response regulator LiaR